LVFSFPRQIFPSKPIKRNCKLPLQNLEELPEIRRISLSNWTLPGDAPSDELSLGKSASIAEPVVKRFSLREEPVRKRLSLEVPDEPPVPMSARTARRRSTNSGAGRRPRPGPAESGRDGAGGWAKWAFFGMMMGHEYTCCKETTEYCELLSIIVVMCLGLDL
jgi:hypothetical protein